MPAVSSTAERDAPGGLEFLFLACLSRWRGIRITRSKLRASHRERRNRTPAMYKIIGADGKEYGPISEDQIRRWLKEGRVNSQTRIKFAEATDWQTLAALPEFAVELAAPPTLPPPSFPAAAAAPPKTSGLAIASLVLG